MSVREAGLDSERLGCPTFEGVRKPNACSLRAIHQNKAKAPPQEAQTKDARSTARRLIQRPKPAPRPESEPGAWFFVEG